MISFATALLGKLNTGAFPKDTITAGAALSMVAAVIIIAIYITYKRRWKWLWREWLTSVDPKKIGIMYILVAVLMLVRAGADAIMMRAQQATSVGAHTGVLSTSTFQQVFSAHGTIMIFFVGMGLMFGLINLVMPLQIGSRDVAFPTLNAASFWLFTAGMILINTSLVVGEFSAAGWLAYPPLSELVYSPGVGVDYWIWSLEIAGIGSLLSGINFITTIIKMRAPGMSLMKMPMFTWSAFGSLVLVAFAFPILTVTLTLLFLDRAFGFHFFTSTAGGNPMMYVNLIWAWGHPEVYILVLPSFGVFSEIVATFSGKRLFGYTSMVWAIWGIVLLSFTVWLHHFFTMGAGADVNAFFGITTMLIAIPTGVKIFNWLFTMYRGRVRFFSPMIWFMGFVFLFTLGGVTGVMMAVPPIDFQVHNSLFLVAHFHTMIVTGVVFGFFAGITYWFPKFIGFTLNEAFGKLAAKLWIGGFVLAFGPLFILGLMGATRRTDHYSANLGWQPLFIVAAFGVGVIVLGGVCQLLQLGVSVLNRKDHKAGPDPWNGRTLEWSLPSPVPEYAFAIIPEITDRDQFWSDKRAGRQPPKTYLPIRMPKNNPTGILIGGFALIVGFAAIWHIWWLAIVAAAACVVVVADRAASEGNEFTITAKEVAATEAKLAGAEV